MYKLTRISSNKKMFELADEAKPEAKPVWYFLANHVLKFAESIQVGDAFDIETEKKNMKDYIIRINKKGGAPRAESRTASGPQEEKKVWTPPQKKEWKPYTKSPEEQEQIRRCNSMTAASVVVAALINAKALAPEAVSESVDKFFHEFLGKLESPSHVVKEEVKEEGVPL